MSNKFFTADCFQIPLLPVCLCAGFFEVSEIEAFNDSLLQMQLGNPSSAVSNVSTPTNFLILRSVEAVGYNSSLGEPIWACWDLTDGDVGNATRSTIFYTDTNLPAGFYRVTDGDYTGVGAINYNRGHLCPSEDRTDTEANNDLVFLMSNIMPQSAANNQGPWATFEQYCRDQASLSNELLIICGPSGFGTNTIPSGKAYIGSNTWKVVVVVPAGSGTALSRITTTTNRVIAIKIPNVTNGIFSAWTNYITTAHQIELDTGFTFFTALPGPIASAFRARIDGLTNTPAPSISGFTPASGGTNIVVTISGTNFNSASAVKFNGVSAEFAVNSNKQIVALVPTNATTGTIVVTAPGGTGTSTGSFTVVGSGSGAPDLTVAVTHTGNFTQGDLTDTYSIIVSNIGNTVSGGTVAVANLLPTGLTAAAISGVGWNANLGTLSATRSDALAAGAVYPAITLTVTVAANTPTTVTNIAIVSGAGETNSLNNTNYDITTILAAAAPMATTGSSTNLTSANATLIAAINPNNQPTSVQFQFGTTTNYGNIASVAGVFTGVAAQAVSANLSNLTSATTYHYRVNAINVLGTTTGDDATFSTAGISFATNFAGTLIGWDMSSVSNYGVSPFLPTTNAANLTVVGLMRGSGVVTNTGAAARGWGGVNWTNTTAATSISANQFISFSVAANPGYRISFTSLTNLDYRRSGTGATNGLLQYQIGSNAFVDFTNLAFNVTASSGASLGPLDLSSVAALQNVGAGTNVTFRLVPFGGSGSIGTFYIFDVGNSSALDLNLIGTVAPVIPDSARGVLSGAPTTNGVVLMFSHATLGIVYYFQTSTNLVNWVTLVTNAAPTNGVIQITDTQSTNHSTRMYRVTK